MMFHMILVLLEEFTNKLLLWIVLANLMTSASNLQYFFDKFYFTIIGISGVPKKFSFI
jgi:hypothetical protein